MDTAVIRCQEDDRIYSIASPYRQSKHNSYYLLVCSKFFSWIGCNVWGYVGYKKGLGAL